MNPYGKPLVIYHGNCPDGFTAAWIARKALRGEVDFVAANYGEPPPDLSGRVVYILDFSYKYDVMRQIIETAHSVTLLDHHKTAQAELTLLEDAIFEQLTVKPPPGGEMPTIHFDMTKSGARLAWEHFFDEEAPPLVEYIEDRDLWRFALPDSRAINSSISSYPFEFKVWDSLHYELRDKEQFSSIVNEGTAIERYKAQQVENICQHAQEIEMDGHKILAVNTSVQFSDVAGKLAEGRPFGAAWFIRADGVKQWSLRSRDGGVDVSEVAKKFGGGGHRNAAGFQGDI